MLNTVVNAGMTRRVADRFVTHLMKRIQRAPVRGISIKLQEEERERRDNFVPEVSALEKDIIDIDPETKEMLSMMVRGCVSFALITVVFRHVIRQELVWLLRKGGHARASVVFGQGGGTHQPTGVISVIVRDLIITCHVLLQIDRQ